jgi:2-phosphosulfolactate phosphatase
MKLDCLLSPAELPALAARQPRPGVCVVFDILRATSTFVTALHHGAAAVQPVDDLPSALAVRVRQPDVLLAGERHGLRLRAADTGSVDFDLGNSPREFTPERVRGRTIVSTTTNGTRALHASRGSGCVLAAAFLNLAATARYLRQINSDDVTLVCAGTGEGVAAEDVLAAGALIERLAATGPLDLTDAAGVARRYFASLAEPLESALGRTANGRRLHSLPDLAPDLAWCARTDCISGVTGLNSHGLLVTF